MSLDADRIADRVIARLPRSTPDSTCDLVRVLCTALCESLDAAFADIHASIDALDAPPLPPLLARERRAAAAVERQARAALAMLPERLTLKSPLAPDEAALNLAAYLAHATPEQRLAFMQTLAEPYCLGIRGCGGPDPRCHCESDE